MKIDYCIVIKEELEDIRSCMGFGVGNLFFLEAPKFGYRLIPAGQDRMEKYRHIGCGSLRGING